MLPDIIVLLNDELGFIFFVGHVWRISFYNFFSYFLSKFFLFFKLTKPACPVALINGYVLYAVVYYAFESL